MISFRELKASISMQDVLEHYDLFDQLQLRGKSLRGSCPLCEVEEDQPFSVSTEKNCFNCFNPNCPAHGDIIDFVRLMEGIGKREAGEFLAEAFNIGNASKKRETTKSDSGNTDCLQGSKRVADNGILEDKREHKIENPPLKFSLKNINPEHVAITKLGIAKETAVAFGAGLFTGNSKQFKDHVVMPIHNKDGDIVAYTGIDPNAEEPIHIYPSIFRKESELFHFQWDTSPLFDTELGIILVKHPLQALTINPAFTAHVVAFMSSIISEAQVGALARLSGTRPKITLLMAEDDDGTVETLCRLHTFFYVRLVRFNSTVGVTAGFKTNDVRLLFK